MLKRFALLLLSFSALILTAAEMPVMLLELHCCDNKVLLPKISGTPEVRAEKRGNCYWVFGKTPLSNEWQKYEVRFTPSCDGPVVLGLRARANVNTPFWMDVDNLTVTGALLHNGSFEETLDNGECASWRYYAKKSFVTGKKDAPDGKNYFRVSDSYASRQTLDVKAGQEVVLTLMARFGGTEPYPAEQFYSNSSHKSSSAPAKVSNERPASDPNGVVVYLDGNHYEVVFKDCKVSDNLSSYYAPWRKGVDAGTTFCTRGRIPLAKDWQEYEISFMPSRNGEIHLMLFGPQNASHGKVHWTAFDNFRVTGGQPLRNPSFETVSGGSYDGWYYVYNENLMLNRPDAKDGKNYVLASDHYSVKQVFTVFEGQRVTIRFSAKEGGITAAPAKPWKKLPKTKHPDNYYRYSDKQTRFLPLADKGLKGSDIPLLAPTVKNNAPMPVATFAVPQNSTAARIDKKVIDVELFEESGIDRNAEIRFAVPFAKGTLYNLDHLRVTDPAGKFHVAQFSVTGFWPDKSIKTALVHFTTLLKANEKSVWHVEYDKTADRIFLKSALSFQEKEGKYVVKTGTLTAEIDGKHFNLLQKVKINGKPVGSFAPDGFVWVTENGTRLTSAAGPAKISVEEKGFVRLTLRADGKMADGDGNQFDYVARMTFTAGSSIVRFDLRFINAGLKNEFTDFRSLEFAFVPVSPLQKLTMNGVAAKRVFQHHDQKLEINGRLFNRMTEDGGKAGNLTFAMRDAAKRYPKAFSVKEGQLCFELLPQQPDRDFGSDLEWYLRFPLCDGMYRMKWGMSFSNELAIDFSGKSTPQQLAAGEVVPVVDRDYVAGTKVFLGVGKKADTRFAQWDEAAVQGFYEHMKIKEAQREYGFLNYGDWYGERGCNWTNNEYDLPYSLFMLYLRTGNRDVYRWARTGARHQADVDICHAYPDPYFHGANLEHGRGHTGQHASGRGTWSTQYDESYGGTNGHVWSQGMVYSWMLHGDAATMDSALKLGEHLTRYISPLFLRLGTHERSAGWSTTAILGLYFATGEQKYLDASTRIVRIIMDEQKGKPGGALPHKLPADHGSGKRGTYGNVPFLMSVVVDALRQQYRVAPTEELKQSIIGIGKWQGRAFVPYQIGWPYGADWQGRGYNGVSNALNGFNVAPVSFAARLSGDVKLYEYAKLIAAFETNRGISGVGKTLAMQLCEVPGIQDDLRAFAEEHPEAKPYVYSADTAKDLLSTVELPAEKLNVKTTEFNLRGPLEKEFRIQLKADSAKVTITRTKHGSRPKGEPDFSVKVLSPDGKVIAEKKLDADKNLELPLTLTGKKGDTFRVLMRDDYKGRWNVLNDDKTEVFALLTRDNTFCVDNEANFYLSIPQNAKEFSLNVLLTHSGIFHAVIFDEAGKIVGRAAGNNPATRLAWQGTSRVDHSRTITVRVPDNGSRFYRLAFIGSGDLQLNAKAGGEVLVNIRPARYKR